MRTILITSPTNQTIKDLARLKDRKSDRAERSFVVEGRREIERAIECRFTLEDLFYCPAELDEAGARLLDQIGDARLAEVSKDAFAKVATREGSDGLIGVFKVQSANFADVSKKAASSPPFVIALENVEKPGNLGAILRTADAVGAHGVIVLGDTVDTWNPNVIRSSLGGVFSVPVVNCGAEDFFDWCERLKIKTVAAALTDRSKILYEMDLTGAVAIILGSEALGLSDVSLSKATDLVVIPMNGICDSLNVSVAAGVFAYEALRQRQSR